MELSQRKQDILAAIVKYHIDTGEPVGSKQLTLLMDNAPSSATLRNEMSELCEMGYLAQPHTSAGRVPTGKGYRFYVGKLMKEDKIEEHTKQLIDQTLENAATDTSNLPKVASKLLCKITGLPSLSATVPDGSAYIKKVSLFPLSPRLSVIAAVASDGRSVSKLCRLNDTLTQNSLNVFENAIKKHIEGKSPITLTPAAKQNIIASVGLEALNLIPLFNILFDILKNLSDSLLELDGESNLFSMLGEEATAKNLLSFIEQKDSMLSLLSDATNPLNIVFGGETAYSALKPSTVIVARYGAGENTIGRIGVIGPTRMSYDRIIPSVEYLARRLSMLMNDCINDMEE